MISRLFTLKMLGVCVLGLTLFHPAAAQTPYPARVINPPYAPPLSGNDFYWARSTITLANPAAMPADVIGYDAYPPRLAGVRSFNPPTLMTSLNYPGVYGDYYYSLGRFVPICEPFSPTSPIYASSSYAATVRIPSALHNVPARIDVSLPRRAELWLNGTRSYEEGSLRQLVTPNLESGRIYNFDVIAAWEENGRRVMQRQRVMVRPGDHLTIAMTAPNPVTPSPQPPESMLRGYLPEQK